MKQQENNKQGLSFGLKLFLGSFIILIVTIIFTLVLIFSVKFESEKFENQVEAVNQNLKNVHSAVDKILTSSGITVKNFGETKINAIRESIKRYADKPELMMQWVQENPQQIDSKLWENFQKQIEVQYTKFEMEQKSKISISQAYKDYLETTLRGQVAQIVWSFPRKETLAIMDQVIQTQTTQDTFDSGIEQPKNFLE